MFAHSHRSKASLQYSIIEKLYQKFLLRKPKLTILIILFMVAWAASFTPKFQFDASAETLLLKDDKGLEYYRAIKARYGSDDYLVITYTPKQPIFSEMILEDLKQLKQALLEVDNVEYVISMLDVPLVKSPPITLRQLREKTRTIEQGNVDLALAKQELMTSPVYQDLLLSQDGNTTAILLGLSQTKAFQDLVAQRNALREKRLTGPLTAEEENEILALSAQIEADKPGLIRQQQMDIAQIRKIMSKHEQNAELFLGGVPMITADSIDYIRHDVYTFGGVVFGFLVLILAIIFREPRWILLPLLTCLVAGITTVGVFALIGWPVTVVSSNFLPLMLIITLSLTVHLVVKYRELEHEDRISSHIEKVVFTLRSKFAPCFYTALTTIVAFGSLLISGIQPLIDFGLMMTVGIFISFALAFSFFPAMLVLLPQGKKHKRFNQITRRITHSFAQGVHAKPKTTIIFFVTISTLAVIGLSFLTVENRFIDYYKKSTEIYQGMETIDKRLGGTTPLDVILDAPASFGMVEEDTWEEYDDVYVGEEAADPAVSSSGIAFESYWFNQERLKLVHEINQYLNDLPQTGKVLSLDTSMSMLQSLDPNGVMDDVFLSILYATASDDLKNTLFTPYMSADGNQIRLTARVFESDYQLRRQALLDTITHDLEDKFELAPDQIHLTGMLVMYNNMLRSFFKSQILTLGIVFGCILLMFIVTFKNVKMACIAIFPNLFAGLFVLGLMGWLKIPLDLMTITIAAICIGIAVDDTIHYGHRFKVEFQRLGQYWPAVALAHRTIGLAMFYTSVVITLGFSVLAFSNFVPTIYFGLLTGCSMIIALIADLALLPALILLLKPYPEYAR